MANTQMERCPNCTSMDRDERFVRFTISAAQGWRPLKGHAMIECDHVWHSTPAAPETPPDSRSDKDYAIEFGGYLATSAENYMQAINQYSAGEVDSDYLTDHWRALTSAVGEFRKRAKRAVESGAETPRKEEA